MSTNRARAVVFIDGNNFYHGCVGLGLRQLGRLNFARVSEKLASASEWVGTRYYVGRVPETGDLNLARHQGQFLSALRRQDARISVHLGRLEHRTVRSAAATAIRRYLGSMTVRIDPEVFRDLIKLSERHEVTSLMVEKAVDVQIAVDMVVMAERDAFEVAYLLSADGDLTPAVEAVRARGKKVFVASPLSGAQLAAASNAYIRLTRRWFEGFA